MPFVKFSEEVAPDFCNHPEHNPPGHVVLHPGVYVWECPRCKKRQTIRIKPKPMCGSQVAVKVRGQLGSHLWVG